MNYCSSTDFLKGAVTRVLLLYDRPSYVNEGAFVQIMQELRWSFSVMRDEQSCPIERIPDEVCASL